MSKRNIEREKKIFGNLQCLVSIWVLAALTLTAYLFAKIATEDDPSMNFYLFGILAAWTGGIWGIGLNEAISSLKRVKAVEKWFSREEYRKTLYKWIIMGFISLTYSFAFSFFII